MATYIVLVNWTDQGVRAVKETVNRAKAFREVAAGMGVKVGSVLWTLGPYDLVITFDAPDDETATRVGLALALQGNVRSTTMRAFGEVEMTGILSGLK
ncbi:GYD domain-containing protein [Paraburkholderia saeva]|uniref:Glutamine synthetase and cystathionine beta-lyase binding protein n=1 Tax=Paraburkholderia saeva TaxID=2777537 RepID=A0A9N8X0B7_9BURK|nr:GYD domain-containing protein [Paraburkholderia saeva]CAG4885523.1 Glutamine synthetase and cystathionine beta-lyase binding protein [Paraburkholderia saeva]CAG4893147.1 Glutamine synthetase and cystathionine beta-lyase binding protein [Paraburkholderia saeva]CAG4909272.1 Glutamine synthetase and cystathionine beta-lyase binding protein [Paraburkholderia saeva]